MALVNINNVKGTALDWAIAKAEQMPIQLDPMGFMKDFPNSPQAGYWIWCGNGKDNRMLLIGHGNYSPSSNWQQGGEIIEREQIELIPPCGEFQYWTAKLQDGDFQQSGTTALEASMRAYAMSLFGEELEIPDLLLAN